MNHLPFGDDAARIRPRLVILAAVGLVLLAGIAAGLARIGLWTAEPLANLGALHGPLMVSGFFGTLVSLDRAVAVRRSWAYLAPALAAIGALALVSGAPHAIGGGLMTVGSAVMVGTTFALAAQGRTLPLNVVAAGALAWFLGSLLWLQAAPVDSVALWWAVFFILTIAGERLERSDLIRPPVPVRASFIVSMALLVGGAATVGTAPDLGFVIAGTGIIGLAIWFARHDVARRMLREADITQYVAICVLSAYAWLGVAGLSALGLWVMPGAYDTMLHALFLGFVFSMVLGHAPIILPAVARLRVTFSAAFYAPLLILQASLLLRLGGSLLEDPEAQLSGAAGNAAALLLFAVIMAWAVLRGKLADALTD